MCATTTNDLPPALLRDYSHFFWKNGARRTAKQRLQGNLPDLLCFETGYFGLVFDLADLTMVRFARFVERDEAAIGYTDSLRHENRKRTNELGQATLNISIDLDGKIYHVKTCAATHIPSCDTDDSTPFNGKVLLWEAGRLVQRVTIVGLEMYDDNGEVLQDRGFDFDIVVWPKCLTLTLKESPGTLSRSKNMIAALTLSEWATTRQVSREGDTGTQPWNLNLMCHVIPCPFKHAPVHVTTNGRVVPVVFDEGYHCQLACVEYGDREPKFVRQFASGYTDIRDYDEFVVEVSNSSTDPMYIPFLLEIINPANITGMCPLVCTTAGVPLGIPMQLSKNWHYKEIGPYFRGFVLLPARALSITRYLVRIVYGFYGAFPAASHAQLCLVGCKSYSGRWEQLAVGCFGETFCLDPDTSWVPNTITDVRGLMLRNGKTGAKWQWTDCGWGGDFLRVKDPNTHTLLTIVDMKTAYVAHGPCLTDVRYAGSYGDQHQVAYDVRVRTIRSDDYARTLQTIEYRFHDTVDIADGWLLMSRTRGFVAPSFAYGNRAGLVLMRSVANGHRQGDLALHDTVVDGEGPFWFSFPDSYQFRDKNWGTGTKSWILRSYLVEQGESQLRNPCLQCAIICIQGPSKQPGLEVRLRPPLGVSTFHKGDRVKIEVEWVTTPRTAADYYGSNVALSEYLEQYPRSWRVPYREASENDVTMDVAGGVVESSFPPCINVTAENVEVRIFGGVGACPIEFRGLRSTDHVLCGVVDQIEFELDQDVHGNDSWQVDYTPEKAPEKGTFSMIFCVVLNGRNSSLWRLRRKVSGETAQYNKLETVSSRYA